MNEDKTYTKEMPNGFASVVFYKGYEYIGMYRYKTQELAQTMANEWLKTLQELSLDFQPA